MKVLIFGMGNLLCCDDGVGLHIIGALRKLNLGDNVDLMEGFSGLDIHSFSTHLNMDFPTMLALGKKLFPGKIPEDIKIIAIEAEDITTISDKCTPKVEKAIPEVVELIKGLL